mgnify:CR=1 FL=1
MLDYGLVGNCITAALVSKEGNVEWMCYPYLDSPSVFAKILDKEGGEFKVAPQCKHKITQKYMGDTNILETRFTSRSSSFRILDFFPRYKRGRKIIKHNCLIRIIEPLKGTPEIKIKFDPRMNYAKDDTKIKDMGDHFEVSCKDKRMSLKTNVSLFNDDPFVLKHRVFFLFGDHEDLENIDVKEVLRLFRSTKTYWEKWSGSLVTPKRYRGLIIRSALVLKLMTYSDTGAIIAAPTTSIPEELGSTRCFDYRLCWVRDGAYTVDALNKIGREHEAKRFIDFIMDKMYRDDHIQILYGIHGETDLKERTLPHLEGFMGSKPVRIGNAAYNQRQNDVYGEMLDIMYLYLVYYEIEKKITYKQWRFIRWLVNQIKFKWSRKDAGIWEFRGGDQHFVYSKLMCYIGVDRAVKIALNHNKDKYADEWASLREDIKNDLIKNGYDDELKSFVMHYGSKELDASILHMAYHEFLGPNDPLIINSVRAIHKNLRKGELVQRYKIEDDFGVSRSSFTLCSFWMIDALVYIGEVEKAQEMFQKLISHSNHLGLFSEDIDIKSKKLIGNFPQAYAHVAIINTSILLSEWSAKRKKIDWGETRRNKWL